MTTSVSNKYSFKEILNFKYRRSRGIPLITNLHRYNLIVDEIQKHDFSHCDSNDLLAILSREKSNDKVNDLKLIAIIIEFCRRILFMEPYNEQLICAIALEEGKIAQMNTGEGKTLSAALTASHKALIGNQVHIITANEYLAKRDAQKMSPLYNALGLSVSFIQESMNRDEKKKAYDSDITYLTIRQVGFDYLSDSLTWDDNEKIQHDLDYCIIDEADFIMVDEARIPLVIAGDSDISSPDPQIIQQMIPQFEEDIHFKKDDKLLTCNLSQLGYEKTMTLLGCGGIEDPLFTDCYAAVHVALHVNHQLHRDIDYIVRDEKIELVDVFTGRISEERRWPDGIQGALEAKEGVRIQKEGLILNKVTIHSLLELYKEKSGMTATAIASAGEMKRVYNMETLIIPPHRLSRLIEHHDKVFKTIEEKTTAILDKIEKLHKSGRPVLVGTQSVKESEFFSHLLSTNGLQHRVLNAKNDKSEALLIAKAGMKGAITISTNMAGRGTDIKLGGPEGLSYDELVSMGGLFIIGTTRFESRRIDDQLKGRAARQGDPGEVCFFVSMEDNLIDKYGIREFFPKQLLKPGKSDEIDSPIVSREIRRAQEIIEGRHSSIRRDLYRYTEIIERQRIEFFEYRSILVKKLLSEKRFCADLVPSHKAGILTEYYEILEKKYGLDFTVNCITSHLLYSMDLFWKKHLADVSQIKEGIHLVRYGAKEPLYVFIEEVILNYETGLSEIFSDLEQTLLKISTDNNRCKLTELPQRPSSTWTFQLNDNPYNFMGFTTVEGISNTVVNMILVTLKIIILKPIAILCRKTK